MSDNDTEAERTVGFDDRTGTYRARFDDSSEPLTYTLVRTVAAVSGTPPRSMEPLQNAVDTGALNALFDPTVGGRTLADGHASFEYEGFAVTVHGDGLLELRPADGDTTEEPDAPPV